MLGYTGTYGRALQQSSSPIFHSSGCSIAGCSASRPPVPQEAGPRVVEIPSRCDPGLNQKRNLELLCLAKNRTTAKSLSVWASRSYPRLPQKRQRKRHDAKGASTTRSPAIRLRRNIWAYSMDTDLAKATRRSSIAWRRPCCTIRSRQARLCKSAACGIIICSHSV